MSIAVLISGGVDSAVVVHQLKEQGEDLHLFYIRIGMDNDEGDCSAEEDIEMCTLIAHRYGLPLEVVSLHEEYWDHVMEYALRTVREGLTPNPDMLCNRMIKFGFFEQRWGKDFDMTATGHYATTRIVDGVKYLATAVDPVKDQTDFLAQITYEQLLHVMFPIGNMSKEEVRRIAEAAHLPNAHRRDSQGICFLGQIDYNDFIRRHLGERPGPIIELETGRKLGEHRGYWFHTIGQRKGLGLSGGPWYVVRKNVKENVIYVSNGARPSNMAARCGSTRCTSSRATPGKEPRDLLTSCSRTATLPTSCAASLPTSKTASGLSRARRTCKASPQGSLPSSMTRGANCAMAVASSPTDCP